MDTTDTTQLDNTDTLWTAKRARQAKDQELIEQGAVTWQDCFFLNNFDFSAIRELKQVLIFALLYRMLCQA